MKKTLSFCMLAFFLSHMAVPTQCGLWSKKPEPEPAPLPAPKDKVSKLKRYTDAVIYSSYGAGQSLSILLTPFLVISRLVLAGDATDPELVAIFLGQAAFSILCIPIYYYIAKLMFKNARKEITKASQH